jgi:hypothetical protein
MVGVFASVPVIVIVEVPAPWLPVVVVVVEELDEPQPETAKLASPSMQIANSSFTLRLRRPTKPSANRLAIAIEVGTDPNGACLATFAEACAARVAIRFLTLPVPPTALPLQAAELV